MSLVANDDYVTTTENQAVLINVRANDYDTDSYALPTVLLGGQAYSSDLPFIALNTEHGTAYLFPDQSITYVPNFGFVGTDSFSYEITTSGGNIAAATVYVTVNEGSGFNAIPVAANDVALLNEDTAVTVDVLGNDSDADGDPLTVAIATGPAHGTAIVNPDGSITYTPDADYNGSDSLTYAVDDGNGGTDTATLDLTVAPVNDNPVAADDSFSGLRDQAIAGNVLADNGSGLDTDLEGDTLSVSPSEIQTQQGGTVTINADGSFVFTPAPYFVGTDSFDYTLLDDAGGMSTGTVTLTIDVLDDETTGTSGNDSFNGGSGSQSVFGADGDDYLEGNRSDDTLGGGAGNDTLLGGRGDDVLAGGSGDDELFGDRGVDLLIGDAGNDFLDGGRADDVLIGGDGQDVFVLQARGGSDTVIDFNLDDDSILIASNTGVGDFSDIVITQSGDDAVVAAGDAVLILEGIDANQLTSASFIFE